MYSITTTLEIVLFFYFALICQNFHCLSFKQNNKQQIYQNLSFFYFSKNFRIQAAEYFDLSKIVSVDRLRKISQGNISFSIEEILFKQKGFNPTR